MSVPARRDPYGPFAEIYDRWMATDFFRRVWPVVERLLISRLPAAARILDVCCGGGQVARALAERGFRVTGLDCSPEMLRLARQNAPAAEFLLADMRSFSLPPVFDGALSTFNSFAHLDSIHELESAFRNVHAALRPPGPFLFDLSMEEAYASRWRGRFQFGNDGCSCTVEPSYDATRRTGRNNITLTRRGRSAQFCIEQRCHSARDLQTALRTAGFTTIEAFDAERELGMSGEYGRSFFLCR